MAKTLILGGTGFIGAHLAEKLKTLGDDVTVTSFQRPPSPQLLNSGIETLPIDIRSLEDVKSKLSNRSFERVFNLSGYINHAPFFDGGRAVMDQHFLGVQNVVANLDRSVLKSFVQVGSSDEYGNATPPIAETTREAPIAPYSMGKTAATHFIQMLSKTESFPGVVVRFFLVYGPGQDSGRFVPQIIQGCLRHQKFKASQGDQLRDFCYIDDIVEGLILASQSETGIGEIFNLASGQPIKIKSVVEKIMELCKGGAPDFGAIPYRTGENMALFADVSKAKNSLKWIPKTSLDEGLRKTIEAFKRTGGVGGT